MSLVDHAVLTYFDGERREMLSILGASALLATLAVAFFLTARDGFAKGLMITVLASATMLSATAVSLLTRDQHLIRSLTSGRGSDAAAVAVQQERNRIIAVIAKYPRYRLAAVAFGLAALAMLWLSRQSWLHGVAAGLLLLVIAQTVIDHYSERRARTYLDQMLRAPDPAR